MNQFFLKKVYNGWTISSIHLYYFCQRLEKNKCLKDSFIKYFLKDISYSINIFNLYKYYGDEVFYLAISKDVKRIEIVS